MLRSKKPGVHRQEGAVFYQRQKSAQLTLKATQMPAALLGWDSEALWAPCPQHTA